MLYTNAKAGIALTIPTMPRDGAWFRCSRPSWLPFPPRLRPGRAAAVPGHDPASQRLCRPNRRRQGRQRLAAEGPGSGAAQSRRQDPQSLSQRVSRLRWPQPGGKGPGSGRDIAAVAGVEDIFIGDTLGDLLLRALAGHHGRGADHFHGLLGEHLALPAGTAVISPPGTSRTPGQGVAPQREHPGRADREPGLLPGERPGRAAAGGAGGRCVPRASSCRFRNPTVMTRREDGRLLEPVDRSVVDIPEKFIGS